MAIVVLSMLGLPVGHAMIGGSVLYLLLEGLDIGTAAEQLLNGMYSSFLLLAIPLFILAAEFMNSGAIMERLLTVLQRAGRALPRRHGARQRRAKRDLHRHVRLRPGGRRELGQDHADDDDQGRALPACLRRGADRGFRGPGARDPALHPAGGVRADLRHLHRLPAARRHHSGPAHRRRADDADRDGREATELPGRAAHPAARAAARHLGDPSGAPDAGDPARLPLQRGDHAHGGCGRRRDVLAARFPRSSTAP